MKLENFMVIAFCIILSTTTLSVKAQTAAYLCTETGAYGYCYGNANASNKAYNKCVDEGGKSCYQVFSTNSRGWGAIYSGQNSNGGRAIGVSAGYSTLDEAKRRAKNECINNGGSNPSYVDSWNDK